MAALDAADGSSSVNLLNFSVGEARGDAHGEDLDKALCFFSPVSSELLLPESILCTNGSVLALLAMISLLLSGDSVAAVSLPIDAYVDSNGL